MLDKENYEYLKSLPSLGIKPTIFDLPKAWYASGDTMFTVARILDKQGIFQKTSQVIDYFEKPRKFEQDIQRLIKEYENG